MFSSVRMFWMNEYLGHGEGSACFTLGGAIHIQHGTEERCPAILKWGNFCMALPQNKGSLSYYLFPFLSTSCDVWVYTPWTKFLEETSDVWKINTNDRTSVLGPEFAVCKRLSFTHTIFMWSVISLKLLKALMGGKKGQRDGDECGVSTSVDENTSIADAVTVNEDRRCDPRGIRLLNAQHWKAQAFTELFWDREN